jgi:uncharacterized protein
LGGQRTFDRILSNIQGFIDEVPLRIVVRINIDSRNSDEIPALLELLCQRGFAGRKNFSVYFAPVEAITEGCHSVANVCMSKGGYAELESRLQQQAFEMRLAALPYPQRFRGICGAVRPLGFVVVPSGDLHKCWDTVSHSSQRIGSIFDIEDHSAQERQEAWSTWTPFENESCRSCKILPTCAGSCAHKFVNAEQTRGEAGSLPCPSWKYQLNERLIMFAERAGTISRDDYDPAEIVTDPSAICAVAPTSVQVSAARQNGARRLPVLGAA